MLVSPLISDLVNVSVNKTVVNGCSEAGKYAARPPYSNEYPAARPWCYGSQLTPSRIKKRPPAGDRRNYHPEQS